MVWPNWIGHRYQVGPAGPVQVLKHCCSPTTMGCEPHVAFNLKKKNFSLILNNVYNIYWYVHRMQYRFICTLEETSSKKTLIYTLFSLQLHYWLSLFSKSPHKLKEETTPSLRIRSWNTLTWSALVKISYVKQLALLSNDNQLQCALNEDGKQDW